MAECTLGKNMNNQHIAHTSAASREGAGRELGGPEGFPLPAGWGRGPPGKERGHLRVSLQLSFPSTELRHRKKATGGGKVTLNFFWLKGLILLATVVYSKTGVGLCSQFSKLSDERPSPILILYICIPGASKIPLKVSLSRLRVRQSVASAG